MYDDEIELSQRFNEKSNHEAAQSNNSRRQRNNLELVSCQNSREDYQVPQNEMGYRDSWLRSSSERHVESCRDR